MGVLSSIREGDPEQEPVKGAKVESLHPQSKRVVHVPYQLGDELRPQ